MNTTKIINIPITAPNRVENSIIYHWECIGECMEAEDDDELYDEDRKVFANEIDLFIDHILPATPSEGWAYWTDGVNIYTENRCNAIRLANAIAPFVTYVFGNTDEENANPYCISYDW